MIVGLHEIVVMEDSDMELITADEVRTAAGEAAAKVVATLREKFPRTPVIGAVVKISFGTLDKFDTVEVASANDGS